MTRLTRARVSSLAAALLVAGCASTPPPSPEAHAVAAMKEAMDAAKARDLDRAEELATRALELRPGFVDPLMMLANIAEHRGKHDLARSHYLAVLRADPTDTAAGVALGVSYVRDGLFDAARIFFLKAVESDPGSEAAVYNLGSLSEQQGEIDQAVAWFEVAASLDRGDPRALARIARLRLAQGRPDAALVAADEALARFPQSQSAQAARAEALRLLGRN